MIGGPHEGLSTNGTPPPSNPGGAPLQMWTVTFNTLDYPGLYVARLHLIYPGGNQESTATGEFVCAETLEGVRRMIPRGLVCFPRDPNDDPVIVETWF